MATTVLVVDDDEAVRSVLRLILLKYGYAVLVAGNADDALEAARAHAGPIDLLLSDVIMPEGVCRVAEPLRAEHPHLKVLYISGYPENVLEQYGLATGRPSFLQKPFTPERLARTIGQLVTNPGTDGTFPLPAPQCGFRCVRLNQLPELSRNTASTP